MRKRTKILVWITAIVVVVSAYPAFVLGYTWSHVARSDLPGGRNGPLDAYRHTLASAVVGFTLGPRAVEYATSFMETTNRSAHVMDRHNNQIGASIGSHARSFAEIEPTVREQVMRGAVNASDPTQITWLRPERWRRSRLW